MEQNNICLSEKICQDSRFIGTWTACTFGDYLNNVNSLECHKHYYWNFKEDNTILYSTTVKKYKTEIVNYQFQYEWKLENGIYYKKLYDNRFSSWEIFDIEYIDDDKIIINSIELTRYK